MLFALGILTGIALCIFIAAVLLFFKAPIMLMGAANIKKIELAGVRPRGFIVEPKSEADVFREERIRENGEQGKDTPISELQ